MRRGHIPQRTCRACGRKVAKQELLRLARRRDEIVEDKAQIMSGRGVYCCAETICRNRLEKNRKILNRAFRIQD